MSSYAVQTLKRVILPVAVLLAVMVGLGLLITKVLNHTWPFTVEDGVNRELAGDRVGWANGVSWFFSTLASTPVIIAVTVVAAVVRRLTLHCCLPPVPGHAPPERRHGVVPERRRLRRHHGPQHPGPRRRLGPPVHCGPVGGPAPGRHLRDSGPGVRSRRAGPRGVAR